MAASALTEADARWYLSGNRLTTDQADTVIRTMDQLRIPLTSAEIRQTAIELFGHSLLVVCVAPGQIGHGADH